MLAVNLLIEIDLEDGFCSMDSLRPHEKLAPQIALFERYDQPPCIRNIILVYNTC